MIPTRKTKQSTYTSLHKHPREGFCVLTGNSADGSENSYGLAWPESLPESAVFMKGLTFVSDTCYENLWHGVCTVAPFVGWSIKKWLLETNKMGVVSLWTLLFREGGGDEA